ncbi:protein FAM124A [Denticeps clupeoides]|uniref:FAM124 domain-containing protein n=1 Tax=Denticeps clupeoides TaxID=299321 RepID=A0AAY4B9S9_9TELE|nr:protein FAM124A [Denticeps clupeoides]XP_028853169.1 protein FAM124A [Denticeps clupeoides]XP_028853170.1 protein FAM124A [Denticeps clupeoides]XP_028853171.1 protein FAM124A [Denticeps clupeoides]XP_028853172.1 protein FAM124A [Denticeps clupeoides]XP_028853173.1 protein FAM124A [Denticeps clupeoides]XP_028853174.1 protein FAM124A [Denticeps clupeoides]
MVEQQDPFLVSVHIIADPGKASSLQHAADQLLAWVHPDLSLFRVSERGPRPHPPATHLTGQPALAVIVFLQEEGKDSLQRLRRILCRAPWCYHHSEPIGCWGMSPVSPACQDFYTLAPGTPLWAVRQVHYGKEIVRFTVYCRYETFKDMVRFYQLLLRRRRLAQRKEDFCFCVVYSNPDTEIQLSLKQLPRGHNPVATENAVMEFRVGDVGRLVPLLPRPCTPISPQRWQTEDYDHNKILLQVQDARCGRRHTIAQLSADSSPSQNSSPPFALCAPAVPHYGRGPLSYRMRRYNRNSSSHPHMHTLPLTRPRPLSQNTEPEVESCLLGLAGHRSQSLCSLPSVGEASSFRLDLATLVGAVETDVDTGEHVGGGNLDLSVVSAYSQPLCSKTGISFLPKGQSPSLYSAPPINSSGSEITGSNGLSSTYTLTHPDTKKTDTHPFTHSHLQDSAVDTHTHSGKQGHAAAEDEEPEFYI